MAALDFNQDLVTIINEPLTCTEVESRLADVPTQQGYVKDSYKQAILDREALFPTGLYVGTFNAAIPHCDSVNVNKGAMCLGVLKQPVSWALMEDTSKTCNVSLVVMLAITDPKDHLTMLRKGVGFIQDQERVGRVVASEDPAQIYALVTDKLA